MGSSQVVVDAQLKMWGCAPAYKGEARLWDGRRCPVIGVRMSHDRV